MPGVRRIHRNERGSALLLALAFLTVFGLWIASVLTFSESATKVAVSARGLRGTAYAADGGIEQAIQKIRLDATLGKDGDTSCGISTPVTFNGQPVYVACTGQPGSGAVTLGGSAPKLGIITLAADPEVGLQLTSNATVRIEGGVYSHSSITFGGSSSVLNACAPLFPATQGDCTAYAGSKGTVTALGAVCDTSDIIAPVRNCPNGTPDISGSDPLLTPAQLAFPGAAQSVPACPPNATKVIVMSPGRYNDADKLTALTDKSCTRKVLWFAPGNYYFDFAPASPKWTINDKNITIVGGEKTGSWATTDPADPSDRAAFPVPGECNGDGDSDHLGVQFIFGGVSRVQVDAGRVELCAARAGMAQQVAVFGVKDATGTSLSPESGCIVAKPYGTAITPPTTTTSTTTSTTVPPTTTTTAKNGGGGGGGGGKPTTTTSTSTTTTTTAPPITPCPLIITSGDQSTLVVHGTVYAPAAVIDLSLSSISYQVISRGIISRVLKVNLTPSSGYTGSLIKSPGLGSTVTADRRVLLRACVGAPCDSSPSSKDRLRAIVRFPDDGSAPWIESWSVVHA